jgi:hypothetical protein
VISAYGVTALAAAALLSTGDYQIGHNSAGDQVDHTGGNPAGNRLADWLTTVGTWSAGHPAAAPVGSNPAIAINRAGQIVEAHDNGSGALWTGRCSGPRPPRTSPSSCRPGRPG